MNGPEDYTVTTRWHAETQQPDGNWEQSSATHTWDPGAGQRLDSLERRFPDDAHRLMRTTTVSVTEIMETRGPGTQDEPGTECTECGAGNRDLDRRGMCRPCTTGVNVEVSGTKVKITFDHYLAYDACAGLLEIDTDVVTAEDLRQFLNDVLGSHRGHA